MPAIGIHLPQLVERATAAAAAEAVDCAAAAERLGFDAVSVNDHVTYHGPWLDGPTLLAAAAARTTTVGLATTVLIPALRGAAVTAQTLVGLHLVSGGRLVAGVGVGSHRGDYEACGLPFEQRGAALEAAVAELRERCGSEPPIWLASWGATVGLRRVARLGDGWVASALATRPETFAARWAQLRDLVAAEGRDPDGFGNIVATLFFYVADDRTTAERTIARRLAPLLGRAPEDLLPHCAAGTAHDVAETIQAFADAGARQIHLWPAAEPGEQIEALAEVTRASLVRR